MTRKTCCFAACMALLHLRADAFAPPPARPSSKTALHLVPAQGKQLAAWADAHAPTAVLDGPDNVSFQDTAQGTEEEPHHHFYFPKARALVYNVLHLGRTTTTTTTATDTTSCEELFAWDNYNIKDDHNHIRGYHRRNNDVVYYPIVGFQFVTDSPEHSRALPTPHCTVASCRLPCPQETLVGFYTKHACPLENPFSEAYCQDPKTLQKEGNGMP